MSNSATTLTSSALIVAVSTTASVETVGDVVSFGSILSRCFLPSATPHPFIKPYRFSCRNISRERDSCSYFSVGFFVLTGRNAYLLWSCSSYSVIAFSPFCLNLFSPRLIDSCVRAQWIIVAWNPYLFVYSSRGFLLRCKLYVCSTVGTWKSGCITFSFHAP